MSSSVCLVCWVADSMSADLNEDLPISVRYFHIKTHFGGPGPADELVGSCVTDTECWTRWLHR
jgi:hypothetical protein